MTSDPILARDARIVALLNRYATPFAVLLVALAIFLPSPIRSVRNLCIGLLAFSIVFNSATAALVRRKPGALPALKKLRMFTNLAVNVVLVYQLSPYWPPIWQLLALTPIATAMYASPRQSLVTSMVTALLLMGIHLFQGNGSLLGWGQVLCQAAFVVFLSLLINDLGREK